MRTYNLVNSVKGGCGKTTFSIWLSYHLGIVEEGKKTEQTVLIDMDLLGTSMQSIFFGNGTPLEEHSFVNGIFDGNKRITKPFVYTIPLKNGQNMNVIFSSARMEERIKFKSGDYSSYAPIVKHTIFRTGLKELLKINEAINGVPVNHFVFDMPPNSDGFSDAAMECIFSPKYSVIKEGDRKNLFMMIGPDWGQTVATVAEIKAMLTRRDAGMPDRIFFVINHNLLGDFKSGHYKNRKDYLETKILDMKMPEEEIKKIYFLIMTRDGAYTQMGINAMGIVDASEKALIEAMPKKVVTEVAGFKQDFHNVEDDELRVMINGDKG